MKARYFILLAVFFFGLFILGMRHNNITAHNQLAVILNEDAEGADVTEDVDRLRDYVFSRMNTSMSFTLEGAYNRAKDRAEAEAYSSVDGTIYAAAQAACDREGRSARESAECVQDYVTQRLDNGRLEVELPDKRSYSYTFHAPVWTPDLAGISIVASALSLILAGIIYLRYLLRRRHRED